MGGMSASAVLIEELRRFVIGLAWMRASSMVRITNPTPEESMVSLIHDGFGAALKVWAREWRTGADAALHALTMPRGANFDWADDEPVQGASQPRVIANLRWRGAYVEGRFSSVVFVNCDLRGTLFVWSEFEKVTFVNCLMDGTIFSDCTFRGAQEPHVDPWEETKRRAPVFLVPTARQYVHDIASYRGMDVGESDRLHSLLPGAPAVPAVPGAEATHELMLATGGVVIYGGRVSALMVRRSVFEENSRFSLRYSTGSGLELVEIEAGAFDIYGSAIRQLTLSRPMSGGTGSVDITATGSLLAQVWIGHGLKGTFGATNCRVMQAWNESDVRFEVSNSTTYGLLGVDVRESVELAPDAVVPADLDTSGSLFTTTRQMDYRRNPARENAAAERRANAQKP
jgi:hypothetical protein